MVKYFSNESKENQTAPRKKQLFSREVAAKSDYSVNRLIYSFLTHAAYLLKVVYVESRFWD